MEVTMEPRAVCRFFERYAKRYSAGAFATPQAAEVELAAERGLLYRWPEEGDPQIMGMAVVGKGTWRRDFTGRKYLLPHGSLNLVMLARLPGADLPDLSRFDNVYAYQEDLALATALRAQGRAPRAVSISASSQITTCWGRDGDQFPYGAHDLATLSELPLFVPDDLREAVLAEIDGLAMWKDDYPYYNRDGSWSAASLRGWKKDDPSWGIKPSEMSRAWWADHPEAKALKECQWTVLAARLPATVALLDSVEWWRRFERIRLLKLSGRGGQGGKLLRHTDITDRAAGTRNGHISRFHIPLVSHPDVRTVAWDLEGRAQSANLEPWRLYYLDQRKPHMVLNPSSVERVHLVVDVVSDETVRRHLGDSVEVGAGVSAR
jgi:hypothetical protein